MATKMSSEFCVEKLKVLADPTRLTVTLELLKGPKTVTQINEIAKLPQSLLSHHLSVLRKAGLVTTERQGKSILYSASDFVRAAGPEQMIDLGCCKVNFGA